MKQRIKKSQIISGVLMAIFVVAIIFTVTQLSGNLTDIIDTTVSKTPDAILASAGIKEGMNVALPVVYYDQKADDCVNMYEMGANEGLRNRQFEWTKCDYLRKEIEEGIVESKLNEKYELVGKGGGLAPNKGMKDLARWFTEVGGESKEYGGVLRMDYNAEKSEFTFAEDAFYPLDEVAFSEGDFVNDDGHNHLFTMSFAVPFSATLSGEEKVEIIADDDTFVFVGEDLVVDMGGIHGPAMGVVSINADGDIYVAIDGREAIFSGINIKERRDSMIRIFHADRDSSESVFKVRFSKMNLNVVNTKLADSGEEGVQIAYDPSDLAFVAPLGESMVFQPDNTKSKIVAAAVEGGVVLILSILLTSAIHFIFKQ